MKIKHWQGYGIVNAKKVSCKHWTECGHLFTYLAIDVCSNNEYNLNVSGVDAFEILVPRFLKDLNPCDWALVNSDWVDVYYTIVNGVDIEHRIFKFVIRGEWF